LDQRYLACTPPPQLLLDDPTYLPFIQLDHKPPNGGSEIISGNEKPKSGAAQTGAQLSKESLKMRASRCRSSRTPHGCYAEGA
jgi:hypothetical protein